jgi:hypothetical protein
VKEELVNTVEQGSRVATSSEKSKSGEVM